ncbi:MAG: carboxypeptidase-like regulatory domain-containing protein, partial [Promethearchaeota archaeon]
MLLSKRNLQKRTLGKHRVLPLIIILFFALTVLFEAFLLESSETRIVKLTEKSIPSLEGNFQGENKEIPNFSPSFDIHSSQNPHILFIIADPTSLDLSYDKPFIDFINKTLGFNITLHDDNNSYSLAGFDAVVISDSVIAGYVSSLANESIPILIMESFTWSDFRLATGRGSSAGETDYYIMNSNHYITKNETFDTFTTIYSPAGIIQFMKGFTAEPPVSEIESLARRTIPNGNERTLITLDKGKNDWYNVSATERRTFWGATQGDLLNQKGWELWNRTLRWILYDDINGSATINVNVIDRDNQNVPNAEVNLTHSFDATQKYSKNTSVTGQTTFTNIPYGSYNLTVEFEGSINDTLTFLNITGQQTFNLTAEFTYLVRIYEFIDNYPPSITDVGFFLSNRTFHANVSDTSTLTAVNLSLTATNDTPFYRSETYTMVTTNGLLYFNESAAQDLTAVNITYNITAIDIAGNIRVSENYSFLLGDITPPIIHEYNVTDYENGTLQFYANITDSQSDVQDPVILKINDSFVEMHLNASGYWVYRTQKKYALTLNYTIWVANDSVGNGEEDLEQKFAFTPRFGLITPNDSVKPCIRGVSDTSAVHENGYVEFTSYIDDWNDFQSGINTSSVELTLLMNGERTSYPMTPTGAFSYYFEFMFNFEDYVYYWINASDLAGNINSSSIHTINITDNAIPIVSYWAEEWGNGTVDFYAEVIDWPLNETTAVVSYTQNWFDTPWPNIVMSEISESQFRTRVHDSSFQLANIYYYVSAVDSFDNSYLPTLDQSLNISVTDKIPPTIIYTIDNSTSIDGEITVTAYATDEFIISPLVNGPYYINISSDSTSMETTMDYNPIFRYWYKTQSFLYGEEVDIAIGVYDDSGNFGKRNFSITIDDLAPPLVTDKPPIVFQNGTTTLWAEVVEGNYGSGLKDVMIIYIRNNIRYESRMEQINSGNFYEYTLSGFEAGQTFAYQITATDNNDNIYTTNLKTVYIADTTPPIYRAFNCTKELINHTATGVLFWSEVDDLF